MGISTNPNEDPMRNKGEQARLISWASPKA